MFNPSGDAGMTQYGIRSRNTYGASISAPRTMAKNIKKDHETALRLWKSGIHEARLLAGFMDDRKGVTKGQIESWMNDKAGATDEKTLSKRPSIWIHGRLEGDMPTSTTRLSKPSK